MKTSVFGFHTRKPLEISFWFDKKSFFVNGQKKNMKV